MSYSKVLGLSSLAFAALFAVGLILSPLFVSAQATTTGLLTVYVQVQNPQGASFGPSNFTATVSGQNPSLTTFAGSLQGTLVSLAAGSYSVAITGETYGFTPSYSVGCNNTMLAGGSQLCVVTMTRYGTYYPNPTTYQYQYAQPQLACAPQSQTVVPGQSATFVAQGGVGGTYNWFANGRTYANRGPSFTVVVEYPGSSAVTVTNAAQTATCNVTVQGNGAYAAGYNYTYPTTAAYPLYAAPTYQAGYQTYPTYSNPAGVSYTSYLAPRLPNAGFEPSNGAQMAFAVVLLLGAFVATYPYVRKVFAFAVR